MTASVSFSIARKSRGGIFADHAIRPLEPHEQVTPSDCSRCSVMHAHVYQLRLVLR